MIREGKIDKVCFAGCRLISVLGLPAVAGIRQALACDLRAAMGVEAVAHGDVIEFRALCGTPVSEVTVKAEDLDKKFVPVTKLARRRR